MASKDPHLRTPTRRGFIAAILAGLALAQGRASAAPAAGLGPERRAGRQSLAAIRNWGCQYQNIDLDDIAASDLDLVVIDLSLNDYHRRFVTPAERARLQRKPDGGRRLVLAYLCVGEADLNRWYWPWLWRQHMPGWIGPSNPAWPGSRHVRFWDEEWQSLVFGGTGSILDAILDIGFDGALLDRTDAYLDWHEDRPQAREEMVDLVAGLAAKARARDPGFLLLVQNAEQLLTRRRYLELIDAHNKESLLTGLAGPGIPNSQADIEWSLGYLARARAAGVAMLATEYLSEPEPEAIGELRPRLVDLGFLPFFGVRELDRLPRADNRET